MARRIIYCLGFGVAFTFSELLDLIHGDQRAMYHSPMGSTSVLGALLVMVLIAAAALLAAWSLLALDPAKWPRRRMWLVATIPALLVLTNRFACKKYLLSATNRLHLTPRPIVAAPRWLALVVLLIWAPLIVWLFRRHARAYAGVLVAGRIALLSFLILGVLAGVHGVETMRRHANDGLAAAWHPEAGRPRVVWMVFDELGYKWVYPDRPADLQMPNFDILRNESYVYTETQPVGMYTELIIPSLLQGSPVDDMKVTHGGEAQFLRAGKWTAWDARGSVLGEAESAGWNVGVAGWWNPYCLLYSGMLQSCRWTTASYSRLLKDSSLQTNVRRGFAAVLAPGNYTEWATLRTDELRQLVPWAQQALADQRLDLVFVHVPAPHYPYPFDRKTGRWSADPDLSYKDGLALADRLLGEFLATLENSPRWQDTTLIVQGDHGWRAPMWKHDIGAAWNSADAELSGNTFDTRPAMIIHLPGQTQIKDVAAPVSLMKVHDTVQYILRNGHVPDAAWMQQ